MTFQANQLRLAEEQEVESLKTKYTRLKDRYTKWIEDLELWLIETKSTHVCSQCGTRWNIRDPPLLEDDKKEAKKRKHCAFVTPSSNVDTTT